MGRILKWLLYLLALCVVLLVVYAYVGPFFGADFTPPQIEMREPVDIELE